MTFSGLFTDAFERRAEPATYTGPAPSASVPCSVRFQFAGRVDVGHGAQDQAVIKVLWEDFPQSPTGIFMVNGVQWKVLEPAGEADGHKEGLQRALLCGSNRKFSVEK